MNKKTLMLTAAIGIYSFVNAQQVIYFDENWSVTTKDKMEYYRESTKQGDLTLIKDYYKNGVLQMDGLASDTTPNAEVFEGKVTWYYPNGKPQSVSVFDKGIQAGISKSFDEQGRITEDLVYDKNGNFSGMRNSYADDYQMYNFDAEYKIHK